MSLGLICFKSIHTLVRWHSINIIGLGLIKVGFSSLVVVDSI